LNCYFSGCYGYLFPDNTFQVKYYQLIRLNQIVELYTSAEECLILEMDATKQRAAIG